MNNKMIIAFVVLVVVGGVFYVSRSAKAPQNGVINTQIETVVAPEKKEFVVEIISGGFSPATISIKKGDIVIFINKDTRLRWPASAVHPTHQCYAGFDAEKGIAPNEQFSFTATEVKSCGFHDHLLPQLRGSFTVTE